MYRTPCSIGEPTEALSETELRFDAKLPKNKFACEEESTILQTQFLKSKQLLPVRHEEKRAIQPILPLLLLERKRDMPPPPSSPPLKHGKSTDLKHEREQNEREQNLITKRKKNSKIREETRNREQRKKQNKYKHRDYSGSEKNPKETDIQEEKKLGN